MSTIQHAMLHHNFSIELKGTFFISPTEPLRVALSPLAAIACAFAAAGLGIAAASTNNAAKHADLKARAFSCLSAAVFHLLSPLVYAVQIVALPILMAIGAKGILEALAGLVFGPIIALFSEMSLMGAKTLDVFLVPNKERIYLSGLQVIERSKLQIAALSNADQRATAETLLKKFEELVAQLHTASADDTPRIQDECRQAYRLVMSAVRSEASVSPVRA